MGIAVVDCRILPFHPPFPHTHHTGHFLFCATWRLAFREFTRLGVVISPEKPVEGSTVAVSGSGILSVCMLQSSHEFSVRHSTRDHRFCTSLVFQTPSTNEWPEILVVKPQSNQSNPARLHLPFQQSFHTMTQNFNKTNKSCCTPYSTPYLTAIRWVVRGISQNVILSLQMVHWSALGSVHLCSARITSHTHDEKCSVVYNLGLLTSKIKATKGMGKVHMGLDAST